MEQLASMVLDLSNEIKAMKQQSDVPFITPQKRIIVSELSGATKTTYLIIPDGENQNQLPQDLDGDFTLTEEEKETLGKWRRQTKKELYGSKTFLLTETNWVTLDLTDADMLNYLDPKPKSFRTPYPQKEWRTGDSIVYGYLLGRLDDNIRKDVNEATTSHSIALQRKTITNVSGIN